MFRIDLENSFERHVMNETQAAESEKLRTVAKLFATYVQEYVPDGPNQTLAIRHIEDALMRANKGISEGL